MILVLQFLLEMKHQSRNLAEQFEALRVFAGHVETFTALTRQEINVRKSWVLETGGALDVQHPFQLEGNVVPVVEPERVLGANVSVGGGAGAVLQRRVVTATERAKNRERLPAPFDDRAAIVGPGLLSLLYGQEAGPGVEPADRRRLRQNFASAALGLSMPTRCLEVVFTVLLRGHATDPVGGLDYHCVAAAARQLRHTRTCQAAERTHAAVEANGPRAPVREPIRRLLHVFERLGWSWQRFEEQTAGRKPSDRDRASTVASARGCNGKCVGKRWRH